MHTIEEILLEKGSDIVAVLSDATVIEAVAKMIEAKVGSVVVQHGEDVVGVFTERDLLQRVIGIGKDPKTTSITEVMSCPVHACKPSDDIAECCKILSANQYRHLLVVDNDEAVGVISLRDVMLANQLSSI